MKRTSLRLRLVVGGLAAIAVALAIAGFGLTVLFERHISRTVAEGLDVHLRQLVGGIDVDAQGRIVVGRAPADPRFADPLSGLYWQIGDDGAQLLRSRSLWDATLALPEDDPAPGEIHHHEIAGPADARLLVAERRVWLTVADGRTPVRIAVAVDLSQVAAARRAFAADLWPALGLLWIVLAAATTVQVSLGLRPLAALRRGVADIRAGRSRHLAAAGVAEVTPLVEEVNALLDAREQELARSRNRAADLAHGLKTPLAALAADSRLLRGRGESAVADEIDAVIDTMRRHVDRELARARIRGARPAGGEATEVAPLVRSLIATLARTESGRPLTFRHEIAETARAPLDRADLAEVLGNLMENAARHARSCVRVHVMPDGAGICVEDDGPGIAEQDRASALGRGVRLDERGGGAGLGLAIVQDVLDAYRWQLQLGRSEMGGLKATIGPRLAPDQVR
ncbi:MAG: sensor histidine kinase [Alphaproteobacteria bacterium]|nr:sensor histidine kinase [Alphaproteobacteria bacterium]